MARDTHITVNTIQVRRRPLLLSTGSTVPAGLVPAIVGDGNVKPSPKHHLAAHAAVRTAHITVTAARIADKTAHDPTSATNTHDNGRPRRRQTIANRSYGFRS